MSRSMHITLAYCLKPLESLPAEIAGEPSDDWIAENLRDFDVEEGLCGEDGNSPYVFYAKGSETEGNFEQYSLPAYPRDMLEKQTAAHDILQKFCDATGLSIEGVGWQILVSHF